jgi:hypothetical protein
MPGHCCDGAETDVAGITRVAVITILACHYDAMGHIPEIVKECGANVEPPSTAAHNAIKERFIENLFAIQT